MAELNFQARFADRIAFGEKRQAIRPKRRWPIKSGDLLHLCTGMKTKRCKWLASERCAWVKPIRIEKRGFILIGCWNEKLWKEPKALQWFAVREGFRDWAEMREWFKKIHGLPFEGVLITW